MATVLACSNSSTVSRRTWEAVFGWSLRLEVLLAALLFPFTGCLAARLILNSFTLTIRFARRDKGMAT